MLLYIMQRSVVAPRTPHGQAHRGTFVQLYSVIQNSMGLRGFELQKNIKFSSVTAEVAKVR